MTSSENTPYRRSSLLYLSTQKRAFSQHYWPATPSHVPHAELPIFFPLGQSATRLPMVIDPSQCFIGCLCSAEKIQQRCQVVLQHDCLYGEKSDGLVTPCDAEVPGMVVVSPTRKLDHAWMVYSSLNDDDPSEADANSQVCEALLNLLDEVG